MTGPSPHVLLIQPTPTALDLKKEKPAPPFGLLAAIRLLPDGVGVRLLDQRIDRPFEKRLAEELAARPLFLGVTAIAGPMIRHALDVTEAARRLAPEVPIVWGGPHALTAGELAIRHPAIDAVAVGEGEEALRDLARFARDGGLHALESAPGFWVVRNGEPRFTGPRPVLDLDALPPVSYRIAGDRYFYASAGRPTAFFETSRGCPHRCLFCYQSQRRVPWRAASVAWVVEGLRFLTRENPEVRHLYLVDDNYFHDRARALAIAERLTGMGLTYQVQGAALVDVAAFTDDELRRLRASGCVRTDIGAETASPRMGAVVGKSAPAAKLLETARRLERAGIIPWLNFMSGLPGETDEDLGATLDAIDAVVRAVPTAMVSPIYAYTPYPGTALFDRSVELGFRPPADIRGVAAESWRRPGTPWLSPRKRRFLERLYFYSIFIDGKVPYYRSARITRFVARAFRPIARWRLCHRALAFPVEKWLFERALGGDY